jgi:CheY-like chemotaxis protein
MENRVHSMARVHESLYGSENLARIDFAEYAQSLAKDIFLSPGSPGVSVPLKNDLEPVVMGADLAVPCGLILNELISNALKHGFPNSAGGEVKVTLRRDGEGRCTLSVEDSGVGIPADLEVNTNKSLGLRLVRPLTHQIRGTFELVKVDPGTSATRERPDLVLMDIRLKGAKDGVQAATEIYSQVDVPVVYLTAHSDPLTVDRAKRTYYDGFILKPFRARELQSSIEVAIQRHGIRMKEKER